MSREKYSFYEYDIQSGHKTINPEDNEVIYFYRIFTDDVDYNFFMQTDILRESDEWFDTEQEARFAAIGHINLLESGEG